MKKYNAPSKILNIKILGGLAVMAAALFGQPSFATTSRFNPHFKGRIVQPGGNPLTLAAVPFTLKVYNHDLSCVLYSETQPVDVRNGFFEVGLGEGLRTDAGSYQLSQVFISGTDMSSTCPGFFVLSDKDMKVQLTFEVGSEVVELDPQDMKAVPFVHNSYNSIRTQDTTALNSLPPSEVMTVAGATDNNVTASRNLSIPNFKVLAGLLSGNGAAQAPTGIGTLNPTQVSNLQSSGQLTPGQIWYNTTDHAIYYYDGTTSKILSYLTAISGGTGVISSTAGTQVNLSLDVGTGPNQILQVAAGDKLPAVDGSQLTNINLTNISGTIPLDKGGTGLSAVGSANQVLGMNSAATAAEYKTVTGANGVSITYSAGGVTISNPTALNTVTGVTADSPLVVANGTTTPAVSIANGSSAGQTLVWNGSAWNTTKLNYSQTVNGSGSSPWPAVSCAAGEVVIWNSTADAFSCQALSITAAQLSGVVSTANVPGLDASKITTGTIGIANGGTGITGITAADANKVLGVNAAGDASELKSIVAGSGMNIVNNPGEIVINGNVTNGTVTNIAGGAGVLGGPVKGIGTLSLNTAQGTSVAAGQYVQLDGSSRLPATSGQNLTNLDPTQLSGLIGIPLGGTGKSVLGAGNTVFGVNGAGSDVEYKGITAGARMSVVNSAGGIQLNLGAGAGSVSTMTGSSVFSITTPTLTPAVSFTSGSATGNVFRWSGSWVNNGFLKYTDIVNNTSASPWPAACTAGNAMVWTSASDAFSCQALALNEAAINFTSSQSAKTVFGAPTGSAGTPTYRGIASTDVDSFAMVQGGNSFGADAIVGSLDAQDLSINTAGSSRVYVDSSGHLGVGTTPTASAVEVAGQMRFTSTPSSSSATIDWNNGNNQVTTLNCQTFTFQNMRDGGMYTLIVSGTGGGNCLFSQSSPDTLTYASNFKFYPAEAMASGLSVPSGAATIFHFIRAGSMVYVNWTTGY